jgi:peptidoglycan/xylan/chitin deacetylase (PgdA/CDA1 family)
LLLWSAAACGPGVPILTYHSISHLEDPYALDEQDFAAQLDWLKSAGFHTVSLREVLDADRHRGSLPPNPIVLTFDDGYQDNYDKALPLLVARGQKATFFVVARFLGADEAHRHVEAPGTSGERRFILLSEARQLAAAGMEIGSHSLLHRRLTTLPLDEVRKDVQASRDELSAALGQPVDFFAYPFNSERRQVRKLVEAAGYRAAVAGGHGMGDRFELPRVTVYRNMKPADLKQRLAEGWAAAAAEGN